MSVTALIGVQWGDEGKGKVVDAISGSMEIVVRAQGGANAGHTVKVGSETRVLHLVPSGMLYPSVTGVIGNGVVVDPFTLLEEIRALEASGIQVRDRLVISDRAHVVLPYHKEIDGAQETSRGAGALGTTKRGIGPAYMDKAARNGIRMGEFGDRAAVRARIKDVASSHDRWLRAMGHAPLDIDRISTSTMEAVEDLLPQVKDAVALLHTAHDQGRSILIEGAQGALLDLDLGTYPFVTSSNCHLGGLLAGCGLPPSAITRVIGVAKAYCTRVGAGPFPTEELGGVGAEIRERGREFGATTGRPRRCGWFDLVAARYAVRTNGITEIVLTKADVLSAQPRIRVGTAYQLDGHRVTEFPSGAALSRAVPEYRDLGGFAEEIGGCRTEAALPAAVTALVTAIEESLSVPITMISTGPGRDQMIQRRR